MPTTKRSSLLSREGVTMLLPFILITSCFALWGFANDVTTPMVKAFSKIFRMSVTEGAMVQVASYLGYFVMAFPAALVIQRYSFKTGVIIGLSLFRRRCPAVPAGATDGILLAVPHGILRADLRPVVPRDQL